MESLINTFILVVIITSLFSCQNKRKPNYQFFPNMYDPVGYEAYGEYDVFPNKQEALVPPEGTIARGHSLYSYANTNDGYNSALKNLKTDLSSSEIDLKRGKELYEIYCGICHGNKGAGQGKLVKRENIRSSKLCRQTNNNWKYLSCHLLW